MWAGCLSFKEFWGVQFEKGCFLFRLQRVFGQWRNSWGASLPAIYILHPLCEAQTFNGTFPQLEIYCAAACLLLHNRAKPFWKVFFEDIFLFHQAVSSLISLTYFVLFCLVSHQVIKYRISSYNFRGNYSFLNLEIQRSQYIRPKITVHKAKGHST